MYVLLLWSELGSSDFAVDHWLLFHVQKVAGWP